VLNPKLLFINVFRIIFKNFITILFKEFVFSFQVFIIHKSGKEDVELL